MLRRCLPMQLRAVVGVKNCIDYNVKVRVKDNAVVKDVKHGINPFDEIAVEAAVKLKEKKVVTEIIAVTIGKTKDVEVLRRAMASGADKAVHVVSDSETEPLAVAKVFAKLHDELKPDLYFFGKQAIDDDACQTPQMLSALLGLPQGTFASEIEVADDKKSVKVTREVDDGLQVLNHTLPAVISCDLRLNTPRFPTLPNIMKAKKKPVDTKKIEDLGVDAAPRLETLTVEEPAVRKGGGRVASVDELVDKLKNEAKVI